MIVLKVNILVKRGTEAKCREPIRILEDYLSEDGGIEPLRLIRHTLDFGTSC